MSEGETIAPNVGERFALRYFILCDDAREEKSKKLTLVGVYTDVVLIAAEAVQLPRVAFVFSFRRLTDELPHSGTFRLEGPDGVMLPETTFSVQQEMPKFRTTNMTIHAAGVTLKAGDYRAVFRVNESVEFVGEFTVQCDPEALKSTLG